MCSDAVEPYRPTRRSTTETLDGTSQVTSMDGSDPSGAGPIAERPGSSFGGFGDSHGKWTEHCNSMWSPLTAPLKSLLPDLKATRSPSTVPSTIGVGTSSPPKILRPFDGSCQLAAVLP